MYCHYPFIFSDGLPRGVMQATASADMRHKQEPRPQLLVHLAQVVRADVSQSRRKPAFRAIAKEESCS